MAAAPPPAGMVFLEAEQFADTGGWDVDQQSMDQMGSPFLLAHGLGVPVKDAGLLIERRGFLKDGRAVEVTQSYYRGDAYDFVAELTLAPEPRS